MLVESVALFLAVSILLYCLFAGADFGAGMLEAFLGSRRREEQRQIIAQAMGPVWEANHVWLVLAVVILFMGFPKAYSALSVSFHIPLTLMLLGIILRDAHLPSATTTPFMIIGSAITRRSLSFRVFSRQ